MCKQTTGMCAAKYDHVVQFLFKPFFTIKLPVSIINKRITKLLDDY